MATREEIREGIAEFEFSLTVYLAEEQGFPIDATTWEKLKPRYKEFYYKRVDNLLTCLHSQGVVIRVTCPDCSWYKFEDEVAGMTPCHSCNSTGYIVEPLIEDGKDNSGK